MGQVEAGRVVRPLPASRTARHHRLAAARRRVDPDSQHDLRTTGCRHEPHRRVHAARERRPRQRRAHLRRTETVHRARPDTARGRRAGTPLRLQDQGPVQQLQHDVPCPQGSAATLRRMLHTVGEQRVWRTWRGDSHDHTRTQARRRRQGAGPAARRRPAGYHQGQLGRLDGAHTHGSLRGRGSAWMDLLARQGHHLRPQL